MSSKFSANVSQTVNNFQPNILDNYDLSTYNISFFMLPESEIRSKNPDWSKKIIIAQTGVDAKYFLDNLEFTSTISPTAHTRTTLSADFKFTVTEPNGMSLIDKIFSASVNAGISNYMQIPYYLEITFKARNYTESFPVESSDPELGSLKWIEVISIAKVETTVTAQGTEYSFSAAPYGNLSLTSQVGNMAESTNITASTFGEAIKKLETVLNDRGQYTRLSEYSKIDIYEFDVAPEFTNMKLVDEGNVNVQTDTSSNPNGQINNSVRTFSVAKDQSIAQLIDDLLTSCPQYQQDAKKSITPDDYKSDGDSAGMKTIHRIITSCDMLDFDVTRNDYQRKYLYAITPYRVGTAILDPKELDEPGKEKVNSYKNQYLLVKNYNWIYTGQNDQILNFDCKFRFSWHIPLPRHGAIRSSTDQLSGQLSAATSERGKTEEFNKKTQQSKTDNLKASPKTNGEGSAFISSVGVNNETNKRNMPVSWISADHSNKSNTIQGPATEGREYVNILFDQLFVEYGAPNLAVINLEIKGDPYWLGEPIGYKGKKFNSISSSVAVNKPKSEEFATFNYSQIFFLLNIGVPQEYDTNTGIVENISQSLYSGVYNAVRVTNIFSGGKFTQTLYAIKHPLIDSKDINE